MIPNSSSMIWRPILTNKNNLAESNPEKLKELYEAFKKIRGEGFSKTEQLELK